MLTKLQFNWPAGRIIIRLPPDDDGGVNTFYEDGYLDDNNAERPLVDGITDEHRVLDVQIYTGFGSCNIPDMIAEDDAAFFVVVTYDGSSWLTRIEKNLDRYLKPNGPTLTRIGG
jgi:hypothetical protein